MWTIDINAVSHFDIDHKPTDEDIEHFITLFIDELSNNEIDPYIEVWESEED